MAVWLCISERLEEASAVAWLIGDGGFGRRELDQLLPCGFERSVEVGAGASVAGDVCLLRPGFWFSGLDEAESLILAQNERWRRA